MKWINRATKYSIRLCKSVNMLHYEISFHRGKNSLFLEIENTNIGRRILQEEVTTKQLFEEFNDLGYFESLLIAWENIGDLRKIVLKLEEKLLEDNQNER